MTDSISFIVFDFDGVFADSFDSLFQLNAEVFRRLGRELSEEEYRNWYIKGVKKAKRQLLIEDAEYEKMLRIFNELNRQYYQKVALFPWVTLIVPKLSALAKLVITSSTKSIFIDELLVRNDLKKYFIKILGRGDLGKMDMFKEAAGIVQKKPKDILFISDTVGDLSEAKQFGFKTAAVTWGFHDEDVLKEVNPDMIFNKPVEILASISDQ